MFIISLTMLINNYDIDLQKNNCETIGNIIQFSIFGIISLIFFYYLFSFYQFNYNGIKYNFPSQMIYLLILLEILSFGFFIRNCESIVPKVPEKIPEKIPEKNINETSNETSNETPK